MSQTHRKPHHLLLQTPPLVVSADMVVCRGAATLAQSLCRALLAQWVEGEPRLHRRGVEDVALFMAGRRLGCQEEGGV